MSSAGASSFLSSAGASSLFSSAGASSFLSSAGASLVSSVGASSLSSSAVFPSRVVSSVFSLEFLFAMAAALSSFFSFSACIDAFSASSAAFTNFCFLSEILFSLLSSHSENLFSASSSLNAPLETPTSKCFFIITPLYDKIALAVSEGCAPLRSQLTALSKFITIVAGFVFGLYVPSFSINLPSLGALVSATTMW